MTRVNQNQLLILSRNAEKYARLIEKADLKDLEIITANSIYSALRVAHHANILLAAPDLAYKILPDMKRLQWLQSTWAGVNRLLGDDCRKDYLLTNIKGVFGPIMAEYVFCYILMHARNAIQCYEQQKNKEWNMPMPNLLRGKKLGIMGVGSIGTAIGKTAKIFNLITYGYARSAEKREGIDVMFGPDDLVEFVRDLDYLVAVLPQTADTDNLINSNLLKAMKPELLLINVGRGNVINEQDLIVSLKKKEIAGAVLDVFQEEPLPESSQLWDAPGVIITSHKAALTYPEDIVPIFIENYDKYSSGKELRYLVDFKQGY